MINTQSNIKYNNLAVLRLGDCYMLSLEVEKYLRNEVFLTMSTKVGIQCERKLFEYIHND